MSALARVGSIWLVGCGNMGGAMLRGWLAQGLAPDRLTVIDPALPELPAGVRSLNALPDDEAGPEVLVLAVKPQLLGDVVAQFRRKSDCAPRSEEHTSELQSLMRHAYAVLGLTDKEKHIRHTY